MDSLLTNSADPELLKPTDLDLHCLQRQDISGFRKIRIKNAFFFNPFSVVGGWSSR